MTALLRMSLQRVGRVTPQVPTNDERLAAYRACTPGVRGNNYPWRWTRSEADAYAIAEAADGREPTTDVHYMEWTR